MLQLRAGHSQRLVVEAPACEAEVQGLAAFAEPASPGESNGRLLEAMTWSSRTLDDVSCCEPGDHADSGTMQTARIAIGFNERYPDYLQV